MTAGWATMAFCQAVCTAMMSGGPTIASVSECTSGLQCKKKSGVARLNYSPTPSVATGVSRCFGLLRYTAECDPFPLACIHADFFLEFLEPTAQAPHAPPSTSLPSRSFSSCPSLFRRSTAIPAAPAFSASRSQKPAMATSLPPNPGGACVVQQIVTRS